MGTDQTEPTTARADADELPALDAREPRDGESTRSDTHGTRGGNRDARNSRGDRHQAEDAADFDEDDEDEGPEHEPEIDPDWIDEDAHKVLRRLQKFGHEAYLVGGCVRDALLGRHPKDFDIATSALPEEVRDIFRNCRLIGRRFRLAHVYFRGGKLIEVSTFRANPTELDAATRVFQVGEEDEGAGARVAHDEDRVTRGPRAGDDDSHGDEAGGEGGAEIDGDSANGGAHRSVHPADAQDLFITHDNVFGTAEEDARRRDFTMNGLFYCVVRGEVLDYVGGKRDLELRQIRTIGDAEVRLREDPVRILRAVRFASKLQLDIEPWTYAAMEGAVEDLGRCAPARLLEETFRLIRGGYAHDSLKLLAALGALEVLLPPIGAFLREGGAEAERFFYRHVAALDARVREADEPLDDALLLSALLLPISRVGPMMTPTPTPTDGDENDEGGPVVARPVEELLENLTREARLPRKIAERSRMILFAQRTLAGERKPRGAPQLFRRHPLFTPALTVFEIGVEATGEHEAELEAWLSGHAPELKEGATLAEGGKRRRRKPRRRRRGGGGDGNSPGGGQSHGGTGSTDS